jgi:phosphate:Na+ symporter
MEYGILNVLELLGALGFFIYGMKIMSEGIQKAAGNNLRNILGTMTSNRYTGVLTGFLITAIVQSSSATTVMTVSFVNAGLISLVESAGIMMGANIGTTITAWLVSLLGFKVKISAFALPILAFAMPMMFSKKQNLKNWAEFLIGFALLFMGLDALKGAVPDLKNNPEVISFLTEYSNPGLLTRLLFVAAGTLLTIIVQSSSAAMSLTIVLCAQGLPIEIGAAMVLGENIGTTITAELAALIGNVHAKRSAKIHSMFNIIGVTWMVILLPYFIDMIHYIWPEPVGDGADKFTLAIFHTTFNMLNVMIMIWFVPQLVKLAIRLVTSKGDEDEAFNLTYIGAGAGAMTAEVSIVEAQKEAMKFGDLCIKMMDYLKKQLREKDEGKRSKYRAKIEKYETMTDEIEENIASFLVKIAEQQMTKEASLKVRSILSISSDLERTADIILRMSKDIQISNKKKLVFSEKQLEDIDRVFGLVDEAFDSMKSNLDSPYGAALNIEASIKIENEINDLKGKLRKKHLKATEKKEYDVKSGIIYKDLFFSAEKLGDHIINVSEAIRGDFGHDDEDM